MSTPEDTRPYDLGDDNPNPDTEPMGGAETIDHVDAESIINAGAHEDAGSAGFLDHTEYDRDDSNEGN